MSFYTFPAVRGIQAGREYYVTMLPLRIVPRLFVIDKEDRPPEFRAQRLISKSRIPLICSYIINNPKDYIFPSLIVSIDSEVDFMPVSNDTTHYNIGSLKIPTTATFIINDGQHRKAAIEEALLKNPSLRKETISVQFFIDLGLRHSQQMFADLNRYAVRPSKSISILFDNRDPFSKLVVELVNEVKIFHNYTDIEKTDIPRDSTKIFTLSGIFFATKELLQDKKNLLSEIKKQLAIDFWNEVYQHMEEWHQVEDNLISTSDLRRDYICANVVALMALGRAGCSLLREDPYNWKERLARIGNIYWHRSNEQWEGRVTVKGTISNNRNNVLLLCNVIKRELGLDLNEEEMGAESAFVKHG